MNFRWVGTAHKDGLISFALFFSIYPGGEWVKQLSAKIQQKNNV